MPRTILITGAAKSECLRIRNVLRRGFRQTVIRVNEESDLFRDGVLVVSAVNASGVSAAHASELHAKAQRAEFLLETARMLSSAKDLDQALWNVANKSKEILGDTTLIFLLEENQPELQCAASTQPEQLPLILESLVNTKSKVKAKLQEVFQSGQALLIADVSLLDLPPELMQLVERLNFMSLMAIPIKRDDEVFGVFVTLSSAPKQFDQSQLIVAVELTETMAHAIRQARLIAQLEQKANTDGLTGLYNKRFLEEVMNRETARAERHRLPLAVLMVDVDNFKRVNDVHGHTMGDSTLKSLAGILSSSVRREDFVFRYGGDEFTIVLPDTGVEGALRVAEHIRKRVEAEEITPDLGFKITVSVGVSEYELSAKATDSAEGAEGAKSAKSRPLNETVDEVVSHADKALYVAKEKGKNRVEIYRKANIADGSGSIE
jgi:diguanylate cyclase (GGDEF)-like protein